MSIKCNTIGFVIMSVVSKNLMYITLTLYVTID